MSDYRDDVRLSQDILNHVIDMYRRFRNTFRFLLQNTSDFNWEKNRVEFEKMEEVDRWILVHFEDLKSRVLKAYDSFQFHVVLAELNRFAAVPLSGFYLDALKDRLYCEAADSPKRRSSQTALTLLTRGLTVLLAPLLSFTSEETYLELRKVSWPDLSESVFLDQFADLKSLAFDAALDSKWQTILELRGLVNDVLDKQRKEGVLKSSQEASLTVSPSKLSEPQKKILASPEEWPFIFQMAEVTIDGAGSSPESVQIRATSSAKCERCWRHRPEVGRDKNHPTLCARCLSVVAEPAAR
jgi:isoleucyl-tRNA synthetase